MTDDSFINHGCIQQNGWCSIELAKSRPDDYNVSSTEFILLT